MKAVVKAGAAVSAAGEDKPARPVGRPHPLAAYEPTLLGIAGVVVVIGAWQLLGILHMLPPLFLPPPSEILSAYGQLAQDPTLPLDLETSGLEVAYGFGLAILLGLPLGVLMGWYSRLRYTLDPFVSFFYSTPRIALTPLFIIWLGIGIYSKVAVVFLGAFFPILINTMAGIRSLDPLLLRAARSFGARDAQIFRTIALPGSVPFILTGFRLGVGHALIGVVVGELIAAQYGVGKLMSDAFTTFNFSVGYAALIIIAASGVALTLGIQRLERRFDAWRPSRS